MSVIHRCSECRTRYTRLAQHVRDWHGWPFDSRPNNQFQGGAWIPWPVLLSRVNGARPRDGRLWCAR